MECSKITEINNIDKDQFIFNNRVNIDSKLLSEIYDILAQNINKKIPDIKISKNKNKTLIFKTKWYSIHFYYYIDKDYILLNFRDIPYTELMDRIYNDLILIIKYPELIKSFCKNINTFLTKFYPNICKINPTQ